MTRPQGPNKTNADNEQLAQQLIRVAEHRDKAAFASLFQHFGPRIKGFMMRKGADGELTEEMKKRYESTVERELSYKEPDEVSEAFMHALFDPAPLRRYVVVPNKEEQGWTIGTKINELVQLNKWGPHSYSRDELVAMLDDAIAGKDDAGAEE